MHRGGHGEKRTDTGRKGLVKTGYYIRGTVFVALFLILPVPYAAVLTVLTAAFGDRIYIHAALCLLYLAVSIHGILCFIRKMENGRKKNPDICRE